MNNDHWSLQDQSKYCNNIFSSELLRNDGSSRLLNNFHKFLSLKKSEHDERHQDLYFCIAVLFRPVGGYFKTKTNTITLTRTDKTKVKVAAEPLLSCVRGSRIPIRDIKTITATPWKVADWMWDVFSLLTSGGAVIEEIQLRRCRGYLGAEYSPVIHEMIQQGKLSKLR